MTPCPPTPDRRILVVLLPASVVMTLPPPSCPGPRWLLGGTSGRIRYTPCTEIRQSPPISCLLLASGRGNAPHAQAAPAAVTYGEVDHVRFFLNLVLQYAWSLGYDD